MKTLVMKIRLAASDLQLMKKAAKLCGLPVSSWARERLLLIATKEVSREKANLPSYEKEK